MTSHDFEVRGQRARIVQQETGAVSLQCDHCDGLSPGAASVTLGRGAGSTGAGGAPLAAL